MLKTLIASSIATACIIAASGAHAEDSDVTICKAYARAAIVQYSQMKDLGCGYTGARWDYRYEPHYDYCLSNYRANPDFDVMPERTARKNDLAACKQKKAAPEKATGPSKSNVPIGKVSADVDLYDQPGGDGNVVGMWPAGTNLRYACRDDNWCKVQGGWIYGDLLQR